MAEIIYIASGKEPSGHPWVLVERGQLSGSANKDAVVDHRHGATFYVTSVENWDAVTADAITWADTHRISAVYVRGGTT